MEASDWSSVGEAIPVDLGLLFSAVARERHPGARTQCRAVYVPHNDQLGRTDFPHNALSPQCIVGTYRCMHTQSGRSPLHHSICLPPTDPLSALIDTNKPCNELRYRPIAESHGHKNAHTSRGMPLYCGAA